MALMRPAGLLAGVAVADVPGLPDLVLDLGPLTAPVGPRGSGKSQLPAAITWLISGRPAIVVSGEAAATCVSGQIRVDGRMSSIVRRP